MAPTYSVRTVTAEAQAAAEALREARDGVSTQAQQQTDRLINRLDRIVRLAGSAAPTSHLVEAIRLVYVAFLHWTRHTRSLSVDTYESIARPIDNLVAHVGASLDDAALDRLWDSVVEGRRSSDT